MEAVLHHDHRGLDDDPEVHRAQRDEVGRGAGHDQEEEGHQQRQRDVEGRDERRAHVAQKDQQHQDHETHAHREVVVDGVGRDRHQIRAVVVGPDVHARRQQVLLADLVDLGAHARQRSQGVAAAAHQDDALHHVWLSVVPDDAKPGLKSDLGGGDVADAGGDAVAGLQNDPIDVPGRLDQPQPPQVESLLAEGEHVATHVEVGVGDGAGDLGQGDALALHAVGVDLDLILLGQSAEARDVDDARDLLEALLEGPVLGGLDLLEAVAGGRRERVTEDLTDGIAGRELRLEVAGQRDQLEPVEHLFLVPAVAGVPVEVALDVGELEDRDAAADLQAKHAVEAGLERHGDEPLDFLRAPSRWLGDDLDAGWHRVGIGLDVQVGEGPQAPRDDGAGQDPGPQWKGQARRDQPADEGSGPRPRLPFAVPFEHRGNLAHAVASGRQFPRWPFPGDLITDRARSLTTRYPEGSPCLSCSS